MQKGTVKWFNPTKGYGFIRPSTGDKDVFVHISAVERAGLGSLNEGQVIEYELVTNRGKTSAENLREAIIAGFVRASDELVAPGQEPGVFVWRYPARFCFAPRIRAARQEIFPLLMSRPCFDIALSPS
jgi:CspA family cold shock protein